jgi:hypothetical protein
MDEMEEVKALLAEIRDQQRTHHEEWKRAYAEGQQFREQAAARLKQAKSWRLTSFIVLIVLAASIVVPIIQWAVSRAIVDIRHSGSSAYSNIDSAREATREDIVLSDVEEQKSAGRVAVIGTLKNTGSRPARGIQIEVELFQKDKFVDQYSTYISGTVGPGETRHFKVACGCGDSPPADHDSFKVQVRGGY